MEGLFEEIITAPAVTCGVATRPMPGEVVSGDTWFIETNGTQMLACVIDGLGHGPAAHVAAMQAHKAIILGSHLPLTTLMQQTHEATRGTRGVVASLLRLNFVTDEATYVGVGNIGLHVTSQRNIKFIPRNGTVGYQLPKLYEHRATYDPGDTFILFSDGIPTRFTNSPTMCMSLQPQELANRILADWAKASDDATVMVIGTTATV
ncbi:MAG: SpoIIE family protein phosphatase [Herpetosiphon sp.]